MCCLLASFTYSIPHENLSCHHLLQQSKILEDHSNIYNEGDMISFLTLSHHQRILTKYHMVQPAVTQEILSKHLQMIKTEYK